MTCLIGGRMRRRVQVLEELRQLKNEAWEAWDKSKTDPKTPQGNPEYLDGVISIVGKQNEEIRRKL